MTDPKSHGTINTRVGNAQDQPSIAPAFRGNRTVKPLPFDPAKLNGLSEKLIRSHHENNYTGSVRAMNAVEQRLDLLMRYKDIAPFLYGPLKREELHRTGSVVLQELYFGNLDGAGKPGGGILEGLTQAYGSS